MERRVILHRYTIKPHHLEPGLELWRQQVALYERYGLTTVRGFVEYDAEPKLTWIYTGSAESLDESLMAVTQCADYDRIEQEQQPHCFRNTMVREVEPVVLTRATAESVRGEHQAERIAIMRRYDLTGDWDGFLDIWQRVRHVREAYGFHCLFAVADRPKDLFTWAFDFDGDFADFPAAQRDYYHDPERVALRGVFDHMADYSIHPAHQLLV